MLKKLTSTNSSKRLSLLLNKTEKSRKWSHVRRGNFRKSTPLTYTVSVSDSRRKVFQKVLKSMPWNQRCCLFYFLSKPGSSYITHSATPLPTDCSEIQVCYADSVTRSYLSVRHNKKVCLYRDPFHNV